MGRRRALRSVLALPLVAVLSASLVWALRGSSPPERVVLRSNFDIRPTTVHALNAGTLPSLVAGAYKEYKKTGSPLLIGLCADGMMLVSTLDETGEPTSHQIPVAPRAVWAELEKTSLTAKESYPLVAMYVMVESMSFQILGDEGRKPEKITHGEARDASGKVVWSGPVEQYGVDPRVGEIQSRLYARMKRLAPDDFFVRFVGAAREKNAARRKELCEELVASKGYRHAGAGLLHLQILTARAMGDRASADNLTEALRRYISEKGPTSYATVLKRRYQDVL